MLSPEWTVELADAEVLPPQAANNHSKLSPEAAAVFKGTDFDTGRTNAEGEKFNPFYTPPRTPGNESGEDAVSINSQLASENQLSLRPAGHNETAENAYKDAGLKWQPCKFALIPMPPGTYL